MAITAKYDTVSRIVVENLHQQIKADLINKLTQMVQSEIEDIVAHAAEELVIRVAEMGDINKYGTINLLIRIDGADKLNKEIRHGN